MTKTSETSARRGGISTLAGPSFASLTEAVAAVLQVVTEQVGTRTSFLTHLDAPAGRSKVVAVHNLPDGCAVAAGAALEPPETSKGEEAASPKPGPLVIDDARTDPVWADHPAARAFPDIGSWLSAPIVLADGGVVGTLCAVDPAPRMFTRAQMELLVVLARLLATHIEGERDRPPAERPRTEEARFQALVQHAADVVGIVDQDGTIRYASPAFEQLLERAPADLVGQGKFQALVHPDDAAGVRVALAQAMRTPGPTAPFEHRIRRRDGGWRWVEAVATDLRPNPHVGGIVLNVRDVTVHQQAEEGYALAAAAAGVSVWAWDPATDEITETGNRMARLAGTPGKRQSGASWLATVHADDREAMADRWGTLLAGAAAGVEVTYRVVAPDGGIRWRLTHGQVIEASDGPGRRVVGTTVDITALKRAEETAARLAAHWSALLESAGEGIYGIDLNGRCTFVNPAAAALLGYAPAELLNQDVHQRIHCRRQDGAPYPEAECPIIQAIDQEKGVRGEDDVFWRRDGTALPVAYATFPIRENGVATGTVVTFHDVTARRQADASTAAALEAQHLANAELTRLNRAKDNFISVVSHEFRTPLTSIQGFSELLRDEALDRAEIHEFAGEVNDSARRLARMVDEMLDLDRLQSGQVVLRREALDLNALVEAVAASFGPTAPRHHLRLDLDPALPSLSGDRDRLTQVVTNLVGNAVKYAPDGGEVTIATRCAGADAHLAVRDRGLGIPSAALETIFERYARVEGGAAGLIPGTGLGLPITREIVVRHGGRIWAESVEGEGSTFQVILPLADPDGAGKA